MKRIAAGVQEFWGAAGPVRAYSGKWRLGSRREYGFFVREPKKPKCEVGAFFVWKKQRTSMRMILDCRSTNRRLIQPPGVDLLSGEGLGRIEAEGWWGRGISAPPAWPTAFTE